MCLERQGVFWCLEAAPTAREIKNALLGTWRVSAEAGVHSFSPRAAA